jgi:hypothetical protein
MLWAPLSFGHLFWTNPVRLPPAAAFVLGFELGAELLMAPMGNPAKVEQ